MESSEARIREVGKRLLESSRKLRRRSLSSWWTRKLMEQSMSDPVLKTQLFRLVDVLPSLKTNSQVAEHVGEYLDSAGVPFLYRMIGKAGRALPSLSAPVVRRSVTTMASTFMAGGDAVEALRTGSALEKRGILSTYDLLGEAVLTEKEADTYTGACNDLVFKFEWARMTTDSIHPPNISVKLSSLSPLLDPIDPEGSLSAVKDRLFRLARVAQVNRSFLNVDMEDYRLKDLTLWIFEQMVMAPEFKGYEGFGIVLQAYLKECATDIARMTSLAMRRGCSFRIRLVKGAYWDHEVTVAKQNGWKIPVFESKGNTDANYELCSILLATAYPHVRFSFASHNVRSVASAMVMADSMMIPKSDVEFQGLYGMADDLKAALVADGRKVRAYLPYGRILPGMSYLVRRLLENTSNESFLRRMGGESDDSLLESPEIK